MTQIPKGVLYDPEDEAILLSRRWRVDSSHGYVIALDCKGRRLHPKKYYLHRVIMQAKAGQYTDHINGNKLDNRKENLRLTTQSVNMHNSARARSDSKTGVKNVILSGNRYVAALQIDGKRVLCKRCKTIEEAIAAVAAKRREVCPDYDHRSIYRDAR